MPPLLPQEFRRHDFFAFRHAIRAAAAYCLMLSPLILAAAAADTPRRYC